MGAKDFVLKSEDYSSSKKGKRHYLNQEKNRELVNGLNRYFEKRVEIPRIKRGKKQELETLMNEEALPFAMFLRSEKQTWRPRIAELN